jgi:hypothetical protein
VFVVIPPAGVFSLARLPLASHVSVVTPVLSWDLTSWLAASDVYVVRMPSSSLSRRFEFAS